MIHVYFSDRIYTFSFHGAFIAFAVFYLQFLVTISSISEVIFTSKQIQSIVRTSSWNLPSKLHQIHLRRFYPRQSSLQAHLQDVNKLFSLPLNKHSEKLNIEISLTSNSLNNHAGLASYNLAS